MGGLQSGVIIMRVAERLNLNSGREALPWKKKKRNYHLGNIGKRGDNVWPFPGSDGAPSLLTSMVTKREEKGR